MSKLAEFREKNPAYKDVPDEKLAPALHKKFYSNIPQEEFFKQVGFTPIEEPGMISRGLSAIGDLRKSLQQQTNDYEAQQPQQQRVQSTPQDRATPPNPLDAASLGGMAAGMGPVNVRTALKAEQGADPFLTVDSELLNAPGAFDSLKAEQNRREMDAFKGSYLEGYRKEGELSRRLEGDDARQFAQQQYDKDFAKGDPSVKPAEASWKDTFNIGATQAGRGMARGFYATLESVGDMVGATDLAKYAAEDRAQQEEAIAGRLKASLGKVPEDGFKSIVGDAIPTIISQGAPIAAAALATVATRNPEVGKAMVSATVLAPMGVQSYGNAYADGKAQGLALEDRVTYGVGTALAEVLPERISLGYIMDLLTKPLKAGGKKAAEQSVVNELAKRFLQMQATEMTTEQVTTVSQFLLDRYYTNPDLSLKDLQEQMVRTALVTPVATTALGAAGAAGSMAGAAISGRPRDLTAGMKPDQAMIDALARQSLDPSNAQMAEVIPPSPVQPPEGFEYAQEAANVAPPLDAASYQGQGADQEGGAGLARYGGIGGAGAGIATGAPARSGEPGMVMGEAERQQVAGVVEQTIAQKEAEAAATGDPIELLVTQAEGAALRRAVTPQPTNGIDIDQDALLADVEAMFTDGGNLMVQGDNAREAVKRIDPKALASALPRGDGSLLVPKRFAGPVMDALQGAKQRVSVAFGGDGMMQAPDVAQFRATVPTQEEVQNVPERVEVAAQEEETRGQEGAQETRDDLIARYAQAEPFSDEEAALSDRLKDATRTEVSAKISAGEMPVFETGRDTFATITPSAQQPGMFQVTRYNRSGVMGDSQYRSVDDALAGEFFHQKRMIPQAEAEHRFAEALQAEAEYQARTQQPTQALTAPEQSRPAPAQTQAADKPKRQPPARKPDPVTVDRAQRNAEDLRAMAQDAGWAEEGGKLIRDAEGKVSRTKWIPRAEWFMTGMEARPDVLAQHIEAAARGEWIPVKSARAIEGMVEWLDSQRGQATLDEDASMYDFEASFGDALDVPDAREVAEFFDDAFGDFAEQSEADAMRAMGFTEEEIANAGGQTQAGAGSAETADARGTAEAGERADEAGAAQEEAGQGQREGLNAQQRDEQRRAQAVQALAPLGWDVSEGRAEKTFEGTKFGSGYNNITKSTLTASVSGGFINLYSGWDRIGSVAIAANMGPDAVAAELNKKAEAWAQDRKSAKEARAKPLLQSNGKPFPSEKLAAESARQRKLDMVPVEVDGGWGLTQKAAEPLALDTYTPADIAQREAEQTAQAEADARAERDAAAKRRQDEERAEVRRRSEAAADTFELGMDPMENLTGQGDIFSQPAPQTAPQEDGDWLMTLFGEDAGNAKEQMAQIGRDEARKAKTQAERIKALRGAMDSVRKDLQAQYDDWAGRVYKKNKNMVELQGDGPSSQAAISVGSINENRRRRAMEALNDSLQAVGRLEKQIATDQGVKDMLRTLDRSMDRAKQLHESGNFTFLKSQDAAFEYILLDDALKMRPANGGSLTSNEISRAMLAFMKRDFADAGSGAAESERFGAAAEPDRKAMPSGLSFPSERIVTNIQAAFEPLEVQASSIGTSGGYVNFGSQYPDGRYYIESAGKSIGFIDGKWGDVTPGGLQPKGEYDTRNLQSETIRVLQSQGAKLAKDAAVQQGGLKFSRGPRMLAIHNLSADNLVFADRVGGLAVPSVGVITSESGGVDGFGEITLIGTRNLVDPKRERVFSSDAYTARFPKPEWPKAKSKDALALIETIRPVAKEFGEKSLVDEVYDNMVNSPDANKVIELWIDSPATIALFLREKGISAEPVMRATSSATPIPVARLAELKPLYDALDMNMGGDVMDSPQWAALAKAYGDIVRESYLEKGRPDALIEKLARFDYRALQNLERDFKDAGKPEVDTWKTRDEMRQMADEYALEFKQWVESKVLPSFGEPFIKVRGKKAAYTLDNIVEAMTDTKVKGKETTMAYGAGPARAAASVEFSDLEQMREHAAQQIKNPDEYEAARAETEKQLEAFRGALVEYTTLTNWRGEPDTWEALDASMRAIAKWATGKKRDAASMRAALKKENFDTAKIPDGVIRQAMDAANALMDAPVPYFEAKPQRAVNLSEFAGAVIPKSAPQAVRDILDKHGIGVREYDGDDRATVARQFAAELNQQGRDTQFSFAGQNARTAGITRESLIQSISVRFPSLTRAVESALRRGDEGKPGGVVVVERAEDLAGTVASKTGRSMDDAVQLLGSDENGRPQGFYDPKSQMVFMVAPNLTAETAPAVLLHEATHAKQRAEIDRKAMDLIETRQARSKPLRDFLFRVEQRMDAAGESGNVTEAAAYIVEEAVAAGRQAGFSAVDGKLMNWIDLKFGRRVSDIVRDFVAMVRAWMLRSGVMLSPSIDDLVALAKLNVRDMGRGNVGGQGGFSRASQIASAAFKRWFGDSKVVDESGQPLVVYHGAQADFSAFDASRLGETTSAKSAKAGFFFASNPSVADSYAYLDRGRIRRNKEITALKKEEIEISLILRRKDKARVLDTSVDKEKLRGELRARREEVIDRISSLQQEQQDSDKTDFAEWESLALENDREQKYLATRIDGSVVYPAYLSIRNPLVHEFSGGAYRDEAYSALVERAIENGNDGLILRNTTDSATGHAHSAPVTDIFVVFNPEQIKSAIGNNGNFDPTDRRINFSRSGQATMSPPATAAQPAQAAPRAAQAQATPPDETRFQAFQRKAQDKLNRFTVIKEWLAAQGVTLSEQADVYKAEERMHSRFANKAEDFREKTVKPLVEKIQRAGYSMDDVAQYLHAQHAEERNIQVASINKQMPDGGSGMKTADANAILAAAPVELKRLANEFRAITERTKQILLDNGIISQDMADAWDATYQHYVPLKGGPEQGGKGAGKGLKANYKGKRALGHTLREEGEWIVENILADHERAIMLAEKNRVGQSLLKMAIEVGRDDLLTVGKPEKRGVLKNNTAYEVLFKGKVIGSFQSLEAARTFLATAPAAMKSASPSEFGVRKVADPTVAYMASPMLAENEVNVYVKGQAIRVQINDELLARAYGNMGTEALGAALRVGAAINAHFSRVYTGYNPEFIMTNIVRDFTTGVANVTGEEGAMMALRASRNYLGSFRELFRYARTGQESQWIKMYREDGGNTGAAYLSDLERLGDEISTEYAAYKGVIANLKEGQARNAARAAGRKAFDKTLVWVERINQAGENAMRLSIYKAMVESGKSRAEAASLAKNATVNFNRKGEVGANMNAIWLFYNAGVQGTAAIAHANFKGKHKRQANAVSAGILGLGYALATAIGASDDEDDYDKLSGYTKERNVVFKTGEGWVKIPVPYGYGFFWNMGRAIADAERKGEWGDAPWHVAASFVEEFTPFGAAFAGDEFTLEQFSLGALPTLAQIPVSVAMNRTTMAGPMRPESAFDKHQPDNEKMWRGTKGTLADELAQAMAQGGIEVSPETMKYLMRTFTGGAGTFVTSIADAAWLTANGASMEVKEVPFARKFYTATDVREARGAYYKAVGEAEKVVRKGTSLLKMGDYAAYQSHTVENQEMYMLDAMAKAYAKAIRASRDYADTIRTNKELGIKEKREQLKEIEDREQVLYDQYLGVFKSQTRK